MGHSSYYTASKLSAHVLKIMLQLAKKVSVSSIDQLASLTLKNIDPEFHDILQDRGEIKEIKRVLYAAERQGYLRNLAISEKGYRKMLSLSFEPIRLTDSWDGKWRIVIFDIPSDRNKHRNRLRRLIKQLGFQQLQQSVWLHPMPCKLEIEKIQEAYKTTGDIIFIEANFLENSDKMIKLFDD